MGRPTSGSMAVWADWCGTPTGVRQGRETLRYRDSGVSPTGDRAKASTDMRQVGRRTKRVDVAEATEIWWLRVDSNHRPPHYECGALTN